MLRAQAGRDEHCRCTALRIRGVPRAWGVDRIFSSTQTDPAARAAHVFLIQNDTASRTQNHLAACGVHFTHVPGPLETELTDRPSGTTISLMALNVGFVPLHGAGEFRLDNRARPEVQMDRLVIDSVTAYWCAHRAQ